MLQIKHLSITRLRDFRPLLRDFSFTLKPGDRAAIIGEEGNGKSTLLKLLFDESLISGYAEHSGEIIKNGLHPGYLAQELSSSANLGSILDFCVTCPSFYSLTPPELTGLARTVGLDVGLFYDERPLSTLSGGEKVKLQLACILMERPDILLLDEPSNDLDVETLEWLEHYLLTCGLPVLYISHDETLLERTANVMIHLEQTRRKTVPHHTVARMPYREYVSQRLSSLAQQEQAARGERRSYEKQQETFRQIHDQVEHQQNVISRGDPAGGRLLKKKMKAVQSMGRRFERERKEFTEFPDPEEAILAEFSRVTLPAGKVALDFHAEQLSAGGRDLCRDVRLFVAGPQKIGIVGRNGVGKTTLLRTLAGLLLPRADIKAAYMPQNYADTLPAKQTPAEYLLTTGDKEDMTKVRLFLGCMKFTPQEMEYPIASLSGGQKAKLLFLKMILTGSNVLLLDEPTRNFSPLSGPVIRRMLQNYGGTVISVSHDRKFISEVCEKVYVLTESGLFEQ